MVEIKEWPEQTNTSNEQDYPGMVINFFSLFKKLKWIFTKHPKTQMNFTGGSEMKKKLFMALMGLVVERLTEENMKKIADKALDYIEDRVEGTENTFDDKAILPIIRKVRQAFDVPDNDDSVEETEV